MLHGPPSARHAARAATMDSVDGDQGAGPGDDAMASNSRMVDDENFILRMLSGDNAVCQLQERVIDLLTQNDLLERDNRALVNEVDNLYEENDELHDTNEKLCNLIDVMKNERRDLLFECFPPELAHARNRALGQELLERGIGEFFVWPPPATPPPPPGPPPGVDPLASMSTEEATVVPTPSAVDGEPVPPPPAGPPSPRCVEDAPTPVPVPGPPAPAAPAVERLFNPHRTGPPDNEDDWVPPWPPQTRGELQQQAFMLPPPMVTIAGGTQVAPSGPPLNSRGELLPPPLPMAMAGGPCMQWTTSAGAVMPIAGGTLVAAAEAAGLASSNGYNLPSPMAGPAPVPHPLNELRVEGHQPNERRALLPPWEQGPILEPLVEPPPEPVAEDRECYFRCGKVRHSDGVSMGFGGFCCWHCSKQQRGPDGMIIHGRLCGNKPWNQRRR